MKIDDIRRMTPDQFQAATGQMEKTHRVDEIRKDIARLKTVLRGKAAAAA